MNMCQRMSPKSAYFNKINNNIIVTCYFKIKNKRPSEEFNNWIINFFYLKSFKVIFTNKETLEQVFFNLFKNIKQININDSFTSNFYTDETNNSLYILQELEDTFIWKNYKSLMELSETKDPERTKGIQHNKYLYTIWNNKSFWLREITEIIPAMGYYWVDIGCIRYNVSNDVYQFVSSLNFVNRLEQKIVLSVIDDFNTEDEYFADSIPYIYYNNNEIIRIQGGFFGGGKKQIIEWCELYIDELNQFEKYKIFAGKDQYIMGSIYLKYKYKFDVFLPKNINYRDSYCNDIWFRFLKYFG